MKRGNEKMEEERGEKSRGRRIKMKGGERKRRRRRRRK